MSDINGQTDGRAHTFSIIDAWLQAVKLFIFALDQGPMGGPYGIFVWGPTVALSYPLAISFLKSLPVSELQLGKESLMGRAGRRRQQAQEELCTPRFSFLLKLGHLPLYPFVC